MSPRRAHGSAAGLALAIVAPKASEDAPARPRKRPPMTPGPQARYCPKCEKLKSRRRFKGLICRCCAENKKPRKPKTFASVMQRTTAAELRAIVNPSPAESRAVEETVDRMRAYDAIPKGTVGDNRGAHGNNTAPDAPDAPIDAAAAHWVRRIQLCSLAIQMYRERN